MKKSINQLFGLGLALCLTLSLASCASAKVTKSAKGNAGTEAPADEYLASLEGSYEELFPVMDKEENKEIWYKNFKDVMGVEDAKTAETLRQMIIGMFSVNTYGKDAVAIAKQNPEYGSFDCHFINGVSTLKFSGNNICGYDAAGKEVFNHNYTKLKDIKTDYGAMNEVYGAYFTEETWPTMAVYVSDGRNDNFKYFAFCGDSPKETFHIEFRYGSTLENLTAYYDGNLAYWLAAGFLKNAPEGMMEDCIKLFVTENADNFASYVNK